MRQEYSAPYRWPCNEGQGNTGISEDELGAGPDRAYQDTQERIAPVQIITARLLVLIES